MIKYILTDLFGTVFDMSQVPREEIAAYIDTCTNQEWPLTLPVLWKYLPPFPDAAEGLLRLREEHTVVALSNGPVATTVPLCKNARIEFDWIVPLEAFHVYKPQPEAYMTVCGLLRCLPSECLMVTANPVFGRYDYGDIQAAKQVGMETQLIRQPGCPADFLELARDLRC
jgi:2-haloalkanoic acid dehalogenase type II